MRKRHKRENVILRTLVTCVAAFLALIIGIMAFMMLIYIRAQGQPPRTDEEVAAQMQRQQAAEPLEIEIPEPATEGSITIYTPDGAVYGYFGEIDIINDGKDGSQIDIELKGWLVGEYQNGEPGYKEESEDARNE